MTLKCLTVVPALRPPSVSPPYHRWIAGPSTSRTKQFPDSRRIRSRMLFSRSLDFFLLPYSFAYRAIEVDMRKLTSRLTSQCLFSSRTDMFLRSIRRLTAGLVPAQLRAASRNKNLLRVFGKVQRSCWRASSLAFNWPPKGSRALLATFHPLHSPADDSAAEFARRKARALTGTQFAA